MKKSVIDRFFSTCLKPCRYGRINFIRNNIHALKARRLPLGRIVLTNQVGLAALILTEGKSSRALGALQLPNFLHRLLEPIGMGTVIRHIELLNFLSPLASLFRERTWTI
jgi:hypothetical protein